MDKLELVSCTKIFEMYKSTGMHNVPHKCFIISPYENMHQYYTDNTDLYSVIKLTNNSKN